MDISYAIGACQGRIYIIPGPDVYIMGLTCCIYHSSALISLVIQTLMTRSKHGLNILIRVFTKAGNINSTEYINKEIII